MSLLLDFSLNLLISHGIHLGALANKSLRSFFNNVFYIRNKLVIINLLSTLVSFRRITNVLSGVVSSRGKVMLIDSLYFAYKVYSFPVLYGFDLVYKARWVGGLLSNFKFVWKELYLDWLRDPRYKHFTTEITGITKEYRRLPQFVFVTNRQYGFYAMKEATSLCIPVISLLNSNTATDWGLYWLPANDRSPIALKFFSEVLDALLVMVKLRRLVMLKNRINRRHLREQLWLQPLQDVLHSLSHKLDSVKVLRKPGLDVRKGMQGSFSSLGFSGSDISPAVVRFWCKRWAQKKRKSLSRVGLVKNLVKKNYVITRTRNLLGNSISKRSKVLNMRKWRRAMGVLRVRKFQNRYLLRRKKFKRMSKWKRRRLMKTIRWRKMKALQTRRWKLLKIKRYFRRRKNMYKLFGRKPLRNKLILRAKGRRYVKYLKNRVLVIPVRARLNIKNFRVLSKFIKRCMPKQDFAEKVLFEIENYKLFQYFLQQDASLKITYADKLEYLDRLGYSEADKARVLRTQ